MNVSWFCSEALTHTNTYTYTYTHIHINIYTYTRGPLEHECPARRREGVAMHFIIMANQEPANIQIPGYAWVQGGERGGSFTKCEVYPGLFWRTFFHFFLFSFTRADRYMARSCGGQAEVISIFIIETTVSLFLPSASGRCVNSGGRFVLTACSSEGNTWDTGGGGGRTEDGPIFVNRVSILPDDVFFQVMRQFLDGFVLTFRASGGDGK